MKTSGDGSYSPAQAWILSTLCQLAYQEEGVLRSSLEPLSSFRLLAVLGAGERKGILVEGPSYLALAFRGALDRHEILRDLRAELVKVGAQARVNGEFYAAFNAMEAELLSLAQGSEKPIYLAGHSLGGALAVLACRRLCEELPGRVAACYTFGCPRIGDPGFFAGLAQAPLHHLINGFDLVPHMPPRFFTPYADAGGLRHLFGWEGRPLRLLTNLLELCAGLAYFLIQLGLLRDLAGRLWRALRLVDDHHIARYVEALALAAGVPVAVPALLPARGGDSEAGSGRALG